jgi:hypothetical protein
MRSRQSKAREKLLLGAMRAEDEAIAYLHMFDPAVALATACSVVQTLATKWEAEQQEMGRRGDPRRVMCLTDRQRSQLHSALVKVPPGITPHAPAEQRLLQILKDLPADRAWWVAHLVVRYQDVLLQRLQLPPSECRPDEDIETAIRIPEAVRRAAASAASYYAGREA